MKSAWSATRSARLSWVRYGAIDVPAFSVQHHPEAGPGPHDSAYLFDDFAELMTRTGAKAGN